MSFPFPFELACFLTAVHTPPVGILFKGEMWQQAFPIERFRPGCEDVSKDMRFHLYTELGAPEEVLRLDDLSALHASKFDPRMRTLLYLHGYGESWEGRSTRALRDAFLKRGGYNVIIADYLTLTASPWYPTAVANTQNVGRHIAKFIDFLVAHGDLSLELLHVLGISLGGQVMAAMGAAVASGRVARLTGLDPAAPGYGYWTDEMRLNKNHGQFVVVIHSDTSLFGINGSVGHADFYPNGGLVPQPHCHADEIAARNASAIEQVFCSHLQAYMFFMASMKNDHLFLGTRCGSWDSYQRNECPIDADVAYMGLATPSNARGDYYLSTEGAVLENPIANYPADQPSQAASRKAEARLAVDRHKPKAKSDFDSRKPKAKLDFDSRKANAGLAVDRHKPRRRN